MLYHTPRSYTWLCIQPPNLICKHDGSRWQNAAWKLNGKLFENTQMEMLIPLMWYFVDTSSADKMYTLPSRNTIVSQNCMVLIEAHIKYGIDLDE